MGISAVAQSPVFRCLRDILETVCVCVSGTPASWSDRRLPVRVHVCVKTHGFIFITAVYSSQTISGHTVFVPVQQYWIIWEWNSPVSTRLGRQNVLAWFPQLAPSGVQLKSLPGRHTAMIRV